MRIGLSTLLLFFSLLGLADSQPSEKAIIAHNSDSISIAPLIYGIEKGFYRREGIDLEFRMVRTDLAVAAIVGSKEVDYMYSAGTAFRAAVRGIPLKIVAYGFKDILFYLMAQPAIQSGKELRGQKDRCQLAQRYRRTRRQGGDQGLRT